MIYCQIKALKIINLHFYFNVRKYKAYNILQSTFKHDFKSQYIHNIVSIDDKSCTFSPLVLTIKCHVSLYSIAN